MLFLRDTCVGCVSSVSLASLAGVNARIDVCSSGERIVK